jgi:UDP-N-acetylglucosamine diphosphorylase/glucosamine-1-phosphate N-acetyltransferase
MKFTLIDHPAYWTNLLPLTYTRPISALRVGIVTIAEKWEHYLAESASFITESYLSKKYLYNSAQDQLFINSALLPSATLVEQIEKLESGAALVSENEVLAYRASSPRPLRIEEFDNKIEIDVEFNMVTQRWHIFQMNGAEIRNDFDLITRGRTSKPINDPFTRVYGEENLFIEEGVYIKAAIINAENGPVYLGKDAHISEGAIIRGPFAMGEGAAVGVGGKFRGDTTLGPYCKVAGEVSNSVFYAYSNKSHEGYVGNTVIGEWCNIGADSNCSNLKNNYKPIKTWNYATQQLEQTDLQFCGLVMGDHTKCGINTMFNTATVAGVGANIFGAGFPDTFIPSFAWGGAEGFDTYRIDKMMETAELVMGRRHKPLTEVDINILKAVYEKTAQERTWEI